MKRLFYKLISAGKITQLVVWLLVCAIVLSAVALIGNCLSLEWQKVVGTFLDPGVFGGDPEEAYPVFRMIVALLSIFFISSLLVSVISNVFANITASVKNGDVRYNLKDFVLVIGSGKQCEKLVRELSGEGETVVVLSSVKLCEHAKFIYYRGEGNDRQALESSHPEKAKLIYILGDDNDSGHDTKNIECMNILKGIMAKSKKAVHCYMSLNEFYTSEIYFYGKGVESSKLLMVDILNENEYYAEQLLLRDDFVPVIKAHDSNKANFVILGSGNIAQGVATAIGHICHYPHINGSIRKTTITIVDDQALSFRDRLVASRPGLFDLSVYTSVDRMGNTETHRPEKDYLDIDWKFVGASPESPLAMQHIAELAQSGDVIRFVVCDRETDKAMTTALHLPRACYSFPVAMYLEDSDAALMWANETGMFGKILTFGPASTNVDRLMRTRSEMGQRANFVYDQTTNHPSANIEEAWYKISESYKASSIYCANGLSLRRRCFDFKGDPEAVYEAEHRRWMMSELLMGYFHGQTRDKKHFVHDNIIPYDQLSPEVQHIDALFIDNVEYIVDGH